MNHLKNVVASWSRLFIITQRLSTLEKNLLSSEKFSVYKKMSLIKIIKCSVRPYNRYPGDTLSDISPVIIRRANFCPLCSKP